MDNPTPIGKEGNSMNGKVYSFEEKQEQRQNQIKLKAQKLIMQYVLKGKQQDNSMQDQKKVTKGFLEAAEEAKQKEMTKQHLEVLEYASTYFSELYRVAIASINQVEWHCNRNRQTSQEESKKEFIKERENWLLNAKTGGNDKEMIALSINAFDEIYEIYMRKSQAKETIANDTVTDLGLNVATGKISQLRQKAEKKEPIKTIDCPSIRGKKIVWEKSPNGDER